MAGTNIFGQLMTALTAQGATPSMITAAFTAVGSALNTTAAQVNQKLTALAALCDNPVAYAASAPAIINDVKVSSPVNIRGSFLSWRHCGIRRARCKWRRPSSRSSCRYKVGT